MNNLGRHQSKESFKPAGGKPSSWSKPNNMVLHVRSNNLPGERQGTESSDFSLISDFFVTLRTILEINVNLKRIF